MPTPIIGIEYPKIENVSLISPAAFLKNLDATVWTEFDATSPIPVRVEYQRDNMTDEKRDSATKPDPSEKRSDNIDKLVGSRLKLRRNILGLTQLELASQCGLSAQQVHKYEQGASSMSAVRLVQAADALAVPVGWFFSETETSAEFPDDVLNILSDSQTTKIISLFQEIKDPKLKKTIIEMVKQISDYSIRIKEPDNEIPTHLEKIAKCS